MSYRMYRIRCSGCELDKRGSRNIFGGTKYQPAKGVPEAAIGESYCPHCEDLTSWFTAQGVLEGMDAFEWMDIETDLDLHRSKFARLEKELEKLNAKREGFFSDLLTKRPIRKLLQQMEELQEKITNDERTIEEGINSSESIEFYEELSDNPHCTPRCFTCGNPGNLEMDYFGGFSSVEAGALIHSCGGEIEILDKGVMEVNPLPPFKVIREYDQWGFITNTVNAYDITNDKTLSNHEKMLKLKDAGFSIYGIERLMRMSFREVDEFFKRLA